MRENGRILNGRGAGPVKNLVRILEFNTWGSCVALNLIKIQVLTSIPPLERQPSPNMLLVLIQRCLDRRNSFKPFSSIHSLILSSKLLLENNKITKKEASTYYTILMTIFFPLSESRHNKPMASIKSTAVYIKYQVPLEDTGKHQLQNY